MQQLKIGRYSEWNKNLDVTDVSAIIFESCESSTEYPKKSYVPSFKDADVT